MQYVHKKLYNSIVVIQWLCVVQHAYLCTVVGSEVDPPVTPTHVGAYPGGLTHRQRQQSWKHMG